MLKVLVLIPVEVLLFPDVVHGGDFDALDEAVEHENGDELEERVDQPYWTGARDHAQRRFAELKRLALIVHVPKLELQVGN